MKIIKDNIPIHGETEDVLCLYKKTLVELTDHDLDNFGVLYNESNKPMRIVFKEFIESL
jgi:hypothetical protein